MALPYQRPQARGLGHEGDERQTIGAFMVLRRYRLDDCSGTEPEALMLGTKRVLGAVGLRLPLETKAVGGGGLTQWKESSTSDFPQ